VDTIGTYAAIVLAALFLAWMAWHAISLLWNAINFWARGVRVLGFSRAVRLGWQLGRIRHRQTFRAMKMTAPAFLLVPMLAPVLYVSIGWSGSIADPWLYLCMAARG
jgi:hypothetical protein